MCPRYIGSEGKSNDRSSNISGANLQDTAARILLEQRHLTPKIEKKSKSQAIRAIDTATAQEEDTELMGLPAPKTGQMTEQEDKEDTELMGPAMPARLLCGTRGSAGSVKTCVCAYGLDIWIIHLD